jgi:hypothetical protein
LRAWEGTLTLSNALARFGSFASVFWQLAFPCGPRWCALVCLLAFLPDAVSHIHGWISTLLFFPPPQELLNKKDMVGDVFNQLRLARQRTVIENAVVSCCCCCCCCYRLGPRLLCCESRVCACCHCRGECVRQCQAQMAPSVDSATRRSSRCPAFC